jgi:hypothetical protein
MKAFLLAIMILPLLTTTANAQEIPKKTNTITIVDVTFDDVVNKLLDQGYELDKIEKDYGYIKTGFKKVGKENNTLHMSINVRVKDNYAVVTAFFTNEFQKYFTGAALGAAIEDAWQVDYNKSPVGKVVWNALHQFVTSFDKELLYAKR